MAPTTPAPTDEQTRAVEQVISGPPVQVLTGGPGTGKTFTENLILRAASRERWLVKGAAPTGKAARRASEMTGRVFQTVHRLLRWTPAGFQFCASEPLIADLVVVDETSMLDAELSSALFEAVPRSGRLLLVGDADQLPSVSAGNVLRDLIASGRVPVNRLNQIHRQSPNSWISLNAAAINAGRMPVIDNDNSEDFFFLDEPDSGRLAERVRKLVTDSFHRYFRKPDGTSYNPIRDFQILCPKHKGGAGVEVMNAALQAALNPADRSKPELVHQGHTFRLHDRVMQTRNNYDRSVFNGEGGFVVDVRRPSKEEAEQYNIKPGLETVWVRYDPEIAENGKQVERLVPYQPQELRELVLSYASTIHKSQGSEYPIVVLMCHSTDFYMLSRQLIYTGLTRAKKFAFIFGDEKGLRRAVSNDQPVQRYTRLRQLLAA